MELVCFDPVSQHDSCNSVYFFFLLTDGMGTVLVYSWLLYGQLPIAAMSLLAFMCCFFLQWWLYFQAVHGWFGMFNFSNYQLGVYWYDRYMCSLHWCISTWLFYLVQYFSAHPWCGHLLRILVAVWTASNSRDRVIWYWCAISFAMLAVFSARAWLYWHVEVTLPEIIK